MNRNDQAAIEELFERLAAVEATAAPRDPEAEALIARQMQARPGSAYRMAQTLVAQRHALETAEARMAELEAELEEARADQGGFLSGLFGSSPPPGRPGQGLRASSIPRVTRDLPDRGAAAARPGGPAQPGFLGGAAQTALGVAGGFLLAQAVTGAFSGSAAEAATWDGAQEPGIGEDGHADGGDDGGDWDIDI